MALLGAKHQAQSFIYAGGRNLENPRAVWDLQMVLAGLAQFLKSESILKDENILDKNLYFWAVFSSLLQSSRRIHVHLDLPHLSHLCHLPDPYRNRIYYLRFT